MRFYYYVKIFPFVVMVVYEYYISKSEIIKDIKYGEKVRNYLDLYPVVSDQVAAHKSNKIIVFCHGIWFQM